MITQRFKKSFIAVAMCLCMIATLIPWAPVTKAVAAAPVVTSDIQLGTDGIEAGDIINFGKIGNNSIQWNVLDLNTANDTTTGYAFLLSVKAIAETSWSSTFTTYQSSQIRAELEGNADSIRKNTDNFKLAEQAVMLATNKSDAAINKYGIDFAEEINSLNGDKLFLLSVEEYAEYITTRQLATPGTKNLAGSGVGWWLRSTLAHLQCIGFKPNGNSPGGALTTDEYGVRAACNLDMSKILFTSSANGKMSGTLGAEALLQNVAIDTSNWKITLLDDTRSALSVSTTELTGAQGTNVSIIYSGAEYGENEYLSAMIVDDSDNVLYYGRLKNIAASADASGTQQVKIPSSLVTGNYTLLVFNEEYNGYAKTDYASAFESIDLTVTQGRASAVNPVITNNLSRTEVIYNKNAVATALDATATVTDGGRITYQWYMSPDDNPDNGVELINETNATYTPKTVKEGTSYYFCVVQNNITGSRSGTISNIAKITVTSEQDPGGQDPGGQDPQPGNPQTGDVTDMVLLSALLIMAGFAVFVTIKRKSCKNI